MRRQASAVSLVMARPRNAAPSAALSFILAAAVLLPCALTGVSASTGVSALRQPLDAGLLSEQQLRVDVHARRHLLQTPALPAGPPPPLVILAAHQTRRTDPLGSFETYNGGWDVTNKHYWGSVAWTGLPLYCVAIGWVLLGVLFVCIPLFMCCFCRRREPSLKTYSESQVCVFKWLAVFGILIAAGGLGYMAYGDVRFHDALNKSVDVIIKEADFALNVVQNATFLLWQAGNADVAGSVLSSAEADKIATVSAEVNQAAVDVQRQVHHRKHQIDDLLDAIALVVVYLIIIVTILLTGIFLMAQNLAKDTCEALGEYIGEPTANTRFAKILPCVDLQAVNSTATVEQATANRLAALVTSAVRNSTSVKAAINGTIQGICSPYGPAPDYVFMRTCPPGYVSPAAAALTLVPYNCTTNSADQCGKQHLIPTTLFQQLQNALALTQQLVTSVDQVKDLLVCGFVVHAVNKIRSDYCGKAKSSAVEIWIGFAVASGGAIILAVSMLFYLRRVKRMQGFDDFEMEGAAAEYDLKPPPEAAYASKRRGAVPPPAAYQDPPLRKAPSTRSPSSSANSREALPAYAKAHANRPTGSSSWASKKRGEFPVQYA
eukprot:SM000090S24312  [mRNA]  locus=s90:193912:198145:+ [translate_table: standard]